MTLAAPNNPRGYNNYAYQLAERGRQVEAAQAYDKAVALAPNMGLFQSNYGLTLAKLGRYQEGLEHMRIAVKSEPSNSKYINNLGFVLLMKGSLDNAATCFKTAQQVNPQDEVSLAGLASVLYVQGDLAKALEYIQKAIRINPYVPNLREHQAQILIKMGNTEDARKAFQATIRLQSSAEKISDIGWSMHAHGLEPDALAALRQALAMVPTHIKTQIRLAWLQAASSDPSVRNGTEAVRLAKAVLHTQRPIRSPETLDLLAVAQAEAGRFPEAQASLREALANSKDRKEPWIPSLEGHLALFEKNQPYHENRLPKSAHVDQPGGSVMVASTKRNP